LGCGFQAIFKKLRAFRTGLLRIISPAVIEFMPADSRCELWIVPEHLLERVFKKGMDRLSARLGERKLR
jgi:hypothetical protein